MFWGIILRYCFNFIAPCNGILKTSILCTPTVQDVFCQYHASSALVGTYIMYSADCGLTESHRKYFMTGMLCSLLTLHIYVHNNTLLAQIWFPYCTITFLTLRYWQLAAGISQEENTPPKHTCEQVRSKKYVTRRTQPELYRVGRYVYGHISVKKQDHITASSIL